jgi:glycosyltransferase involved in cell wall biosynthesis
MTQTTVEPAEASWDGVWVVIPAYDEARTIRRLTREVLALCPRVVVVNDASRDETLTELATLPAVVLSHDVNLGKAASLRTAFAYALAQGAQCVISLDGDGQHDPSDAPSLLFAWRRHPNAIVIGARLHDRAHFPAARYWANRVASFWVSWAAGRPIADSQSGFRVYPRAVMQLALEGSVESGRFAFESEILIEASRRGVGTLAVAIPSCYPKQARASHFRPLRDILEITVMVAGRLLRRGMAPRDLWNSFKPALVLRERVQAEQRSP